MSSDFTEFLSQPFITGMLSLMCTVFLLLVATIAALVYVRRRRAQKKAAESAPSGFVTAPSPVSFNQMDMPDLDQLMHQPVQPPAPAAKVTAAPVPVTNAPAPPARPSRKGTFTVTPKDGGSTEAVEVLTILRDVVDGKLIIQMGEKAYENVNIDPEFKERFGKLMRELGQMVGKASAPAPTPVQAAEPTPSPEPEDLPIPPASEAVRPNEPSFLIPKQPAAPPPPIAMDGKMPGDLPSFKLADNPLQKLKRGRKPDLQPVPEINIAGAIEAYLQHKLSYTPEYSGRSIHIYPAPGGGVRIEVDGQFFEAVSDVSDVGVREFLSTTIGEWQDRH